MNHKYIVTLTEEERKMLQELITKGRTQGYRIKYAQILLKLDEIPENREWTYAKIKEAYHATPHTICQIAKRSDEHTEKNELKPWQKKEWCIPRPGAEFVARMEDVLDVYQRPCDPLRPVVCLDETNRQLIEKRVSRQNLETWNGKTTSTAAVA